jgi:hypothetical protein
MPDKCWDESEKDGDRAAAPRDRDGLGAHLLTLHCVTYGCYSRTSRLRFQRDSVIFPLYSWLFSPVLRPTF